MSRFLLTLIPLPFTVALVCLWAGRYERVGGSSVFLMDLRKANPALAFPAFWAGPAGTDGLRMAAGRPDTVVDFPVTLPPGCDAVFVRYRVLAKGIVRGPEETDDGKLHLVWRDPADGGNDRPVYVSSAVGTADDGWQEAVWARPKGRTLAFRIMNSGQEGEFIVDGLEIAPVRETMLWKAGIGALCVAWCGWLFWFFRSGGATGMMRVFVVTALWAFMFHHFVIPGPWRMVKPFVRDFTLPQAGEYAIPPSAGKVKFHEILPAEEAIANEMGPILWVKITFRAVRPALHVLFVMAPVLASAFLVGRKKAWIIGALFSVAVEAAQIGFGYGFDLVDVGDLIFDAAGIVLALWSHAWLGRKFPALQ